MTISSGMPMRSSVARSNALMSRCSADCKQMQVEVDHRRRDVFQRVAALVEGARRDQLLQQVLRHRLAGAEVARELAQDFRLLEPVLVELRGQLDPVGQDAGAGHRRIGDVRQKAVQRVAELVEQRAGVVERQQRRVALVEVHHVEHQRAHVVAAEAAPGRAACPSRRRCACSAARNNRRRTGRHGCRRRPAPPRRARRDARPARPPCGRSGRTACRRCGTPPR